MADGICSNCGVSLLGEYCHRCGQKELDTEWRSLSSIGRQFWDELVSLDYKSVRSLAALFYPGFLAAEFIAGRRSRYLSPLKVYLLMVALFFVVAPRVTDFTFERQMAIAWNSDFRDRVERKIAATHISRELFAERFAAKLQTVYTVMPILSVCSMTLILRLLYRHRFPRLGPHAVFALYHTSFVYFVALVIHGVNHTFKVPTPYILLAIQSAILTPYMFLALRRVYEEPRGRTLRKTFAILVLAFVIDIPIAITATQLSIALT